jgi:ubiquinone/menaquinone biosynthesis C-methylase UbiE
MSETRYVFSNAWELAERRLEFLELEHDPTTKRRALDLGLQSGWRCLEVGAGRGSIVRWLSDVVGPSGHVFAVDIDTRFLNALPGNVELHRLDVVTDELPAAQFDFVHTRLLLMHLPERNEILRKLVSALRPGGWILCEENDVFPILGAAAGLYKDAWLSFVRGMLAAGVDPTWVRTLPASLEQLGLLNIRTDVVVPFFRGGSNEAQFWTLTWMQSMDKVVASGASRDVIDSAIRLLDDPSVWLYGPAMVGVAGRVVA